MKSNNIKRAKKKEKVCASLLKCNSALNTYERMSVCPNAMFDIT